MTMTDADDNHPILPHRRKPAPLTAERWGQANRILLGSCAHGTRTVEFVLSELPGSLPFMQIVSIDQDGRVRAVQNLSGRQIEEFERCIATFRDVYRTTMAARPKASTRQRPAEPVPGRGVPRGAVTPPARPR